MSGEVRQVAVLGGLGVRPADRLTGASRRLLAYLAVRGPVVHRWLAAMHLWPDVPELRARANLRRALWQLPAGWVSTGGEELALEAAVDLRSAQSVADLALSSTMLEPWQVELLRHDLLPGWYEEWLTPDQDLFHLQRIQALEAVCRTATTGHAYELASMAGLAAVCAEPLRESAVRALVDAHLAEGNRFDAVRRYDAYAGLLRRELDTEPGADLAARVSRYTRLRR